MTIFGDPEFWLPLAFAGLMGFAILVYVVLDGFDLGIGMLFPLADDAEQNRMIGAIGPFWDANETWLVLAVGLLLVAFPIAHGIILTALYLPAAVMLIGLILRGVAFEFRAKVPVSRKKTWNRVFFAGSLLASLSQGFMLGIYVSGLEVTPASVAFSMLTAVCIAAGYVFIGTTWLILKTDGTLQEKAVRWSRLSLAGAAAGLTAVSIASPLASPRKFAKWFAMPEALLLAPLPLLSACLVIALWRTLGTLPRRDDRLCWLPFVLATGLTVLAFAGLAYSFFPYVVPEKLTMQEAASAPESLFAIFLGVCLVMPAIVGYTIFSYTVFRGKATELRYD